MGVMTTSGAILRKAGLNVSTNIPGEAWEEWASGAESIINSQTRENWSANFGVLSEKVKYILAETAASIAAKSAINYDMSGYTSRGEAQVMLAVLDDQINKNLKTLEEEKHKDFITGAT